MSFSALVSRMGRVGGGFSMCGRGRSSRYFSPGMSSRGNYYRVSLRVLPYMNYFPELVLLYLDLRWYFQLFTSLVAIRIARSSFHGPFKVKALYLSCDCEPPHSILWERQSWCFLCRCYYPMKQTSVSICLWGAGPWPYSWASCQISCRLNQVVLCLLCIM